jgi:hypothetical protein
MFDKMDPVICNRLLAFIYPDESSMTDEEVKAELKRARINTQPAMNRIRCALKKAKEKEQARSALGNAKEKRLKMLELAQGLSTTVLNTRDEVQQWIMQNFSGPSQALYCRKLEDSSDADLKSLIEDIQLLEGLDNKANDEE